VDHGERVADRLDDTTEEARYAHRLRRRPDRISDVHIDMERQPCSCQVGNQSDPYAAVDVLIADDLDPGREVSKTSPSSTETAAVSHMRAEMSAASLAIRMPARSMSLVGRRLS